MAKTSTQIEIPVSLKASLEGLKEVKTQVSQALDKAGKNTTLGKTLSKELSTVAAKFGEIDEILLSPTIDESGLKRLERLADQISSHFTQSFAKIDFSSFEQFATEDQLTRMRELQELTRKQRRELEAINKHGSQERTDTYLMRTDNEVALNHMRNYKGFDATQTLSKNQQAMERLSQSHERTLADMKKQLEEYDQKASESFNAWDAADKRVKVLEPQVATLRKDSYAATFYDKIGRMNTRISANPETVNPKISSIEKELGSALRSIEAGGVIATEARDALKDWITHTFTNISSTEASQMVGMTVNKLLEKLMEKIFGQGYEADREGGYDFSHSALLARGQDFADDSVKRLNAKHSTGSASDLALVSQQKIKELREAKIEATTQENATEHYMDLGMALEAQITETQQAANHTRFLAQELGRYAEAAKRAAQASKQGEINDSEQAQRDQVAQAKQEQKNIYDPLKQAHGNAKSNVDASVKEASGSLSIADAAAAEAEDFKKHLKQSITHWASAQQIINVVKDGIRQAYQDIKALDQAMTNIAVVTDMSIGDLWGKINEYMSIAKQYGVTTQGVYEVSQLYYQQGLSTSEVMAATTETLKMARIAGMDYAEAADAMTVAIRAFKMEMTDAEHVTDVYSKVAAVTASDSEELAIAMSKTASSAESVGSSFENTTAMLAVMIETTRESAQNLGSALKSIISRYGEMKVGMTVDSEGEEIDYNKVDTALKSVGISIKDAQGQFRDFDDVIFELSKKWDGLDKNTQRYIATIMAGNRQQSRFIALVDNWERLDEVSAAAADSADAGLLQYAKTLDSLDTKLNNMKTSFQNFYMSIINGPIVAQFMGFIQNILDGFNKLGQWQSLLNVVGLINSVKLIGTLLVSAISGPLAQMRAKWKEHFEEITRMAAASGKEAGEEHVKGAQSTNNPDGWATSTKLGKGISIGGALVGSALTAAGTAVAADNAQAGSVMSGIGNVANFASMGAAFGPWGAAIGAIVGGLASLPAIIDAFDPVKIAEEKIQKAEKALQEAEIERAQKKEDARNLEATLENLRKLQEARYDSEEAMQAYLEASDAAIEKYPELANTVDASGRQIADVLTNTTQAELLLVEARKQAAEATYAAAVAERQKLAAEIEARKERQNYYKYWQDTSATKDGEHDRISWEERWLHDAGIFQASDTKLTNAEVFELIRDLYTPGSKLYNQLSSGDESLFKGTDFEGKTFTERQQMMDDYLLYLFGGDTNITGGASSAYDALKYHDQLFNSSIDAAYEKSYESTDAAMVQQAANLAFTNTRKNNIAESWQDVSWLNNLAMAHVADNFKLEDGYADANGLTSSGQVALDSVVRETAIGMDQFYSSHADDLEEINELIAQASAGKISKNDYIEGLKRFDINEDSFIYEPLMDQYYQQDNASRAFYANAILGEGAVPTYEEFLKNNKNLTDSADARADYNEYLRETIQKTAATNGAYLAEFVANASERQLQEYLAITKEYTDAEDIAGPSGEVARKRLAWMQKIYTGEYQDMPGMSDYSVLSPEAQAEFFRLLNTDAGTHKWAQDLNAFEKQYGVELGNWDEYAFENFSVRTQNIIDNATSVTDTIKEIGEKHNKGFSWEESQKLLKQIQAIDPSATWTSLFKVTEDGLIVLEDANETIRQLYIEQATDLDNQQVAINNAIGASQAKQNALEDQIFSKLTDDQWKNLNDTASASVASDIMSILNISDPELEAEILAGIQTGAIHSYESLITFLEEQREVLEAAGIYVDAQIEQLKGANAFQTWSSGKVVDTSQFKKEGTLTDYGDIWNKQINQKFDTTNWDQKDWDWWYGYYQKDLIAAGARVDELGNVIWETEEAMVKYFTDHLGYTDEVANELAAGAIYADKLRTDNNKKNLQTAADNFVAEMIETGEASAEAIDAFVQAIAPNASKETQLAIYKIIEEGIAEGLDPASIIGNLQYEGYAIDIEDEQTQAVILDAIDKRAERFFELYGKWLEGTITETELIEFTELSEITKYALPDLTKSVSEGARETVEAYGIMLKEALDTGNQAAIESAREGFKNATVDYLNQLALNEEFGANGEGLDLYSTIGNINKAAGVYTSEMFGAIAGQTDGSFDFEAFNKYYTWDSEAQGFIRTGAGTTKEALIAIYGEDVPEAIINAYDASEFDKEVQKAIEHDNNLTSIPEKFASLISDPLNATLEELIEFWESLLGRDLTTDEYQQVYDARQAAINGNTEMLNNMFDGWSSLAINQGYDVRWETIKQATFGEQAKNQANIEKWLNGEGTVDDLGQLWIDQYDAAVTDDTLEQFINKKIGSMRGAFIDTAGNLIVTDYEEFMGYLAQEGLVDEATLTQYAAEIQDTTLETIKSIFDYINKAIEGTLTATELRDMGKAVVNSGVMSADEWHTFASQNVGRVGTGYKMDEAAAFALQVNTGNYDFEDLVDQFDSIEEVNEMLEELSENSKQFGDEFVDAAKRVLESIKMIKAQDPGDAMFNWMDQDMEGWAGTYESTMGSIEKANEAIAGAMETGTMGLNDFYNMSQLMTQHLMATGDTGAVKAWQDTAAAIYDTATATNGGMVNIAEAGVDMEKVLSGFSKATEEHYQNIAKQQIDFIDKQIAALEAQKKVDEALKGGNGSSSAALNREDLVYTGITGDIGLYSEEEYAAAEKKWYERNRVPGEDEYDPNAPEAGTAFATIVSKYIGEATQDALKAGLDITDAQVQQQIKDSAMARAGVSGYSDTLTDENLAVLTTISEDVATIRDNTAPDNTTQVPPPGPVYTTITEEDVLTEFNKAVELYDRDNTIITGQIDPQSIGDINSYMTKVFGNLDWQTILASSNAKVGNSTFTGSQIYAMNFAPHPVPVDITIADTTGEAQEEAQVTAETFQTTLNDNPAHIHIGGDTTGAWTAAKRTISKINALTAAVKVNLDIAPATVQVTADSEVDAITFASATGNVSGLAFATGTEKLIAGANLANKSLVGELGPELAVYNGQYHLLGANGAEFANIPSNAIIFNHKQTEGILKGQANIRGRVKDGGEAFAEGNISGPAYASGIDAAIKALLEARAMWQSLLDRNLSDLAGIASQGGGGNVAKAYSDELEEWYNLLRQIADIEAEINQLVAERTNLQNEYNGEASLRNLREQQALLNRQLATQEQLLVYQRAQLDRQKEKIANDKILSQFIKVNEDGIIQYRNGNERGDGKGAIDVLQNLNTMSAKEQLAYVTSLGFQNTDAAKDQDGKLLEGEDLVQAFYDYIQGAIDEYDGLNDTINNSTTELENIKAKVAEINSEVHQNELDLEQNIYDTYVDAWEASIDALEEQKDLIEEANDAYTEGLREALDAERKAYEDEASVADREKLQRELSLLRRSGGSASEIADLEEQLDNALKDEYFKSQEDMISDIEEANANQIKLLEKQIQIEEDTLEYEKENGVIWQKVADIMSSSKEEILAFLSGTDPAFFSQSKLTQIDALNEWAYSVGMYKEDQLIKSQSADFSNGVVGESADGSGGANIWESEQLKDYKDYYAGLDDTKKAAVNDAYGTAYAKAIAEGATQEDARTAGYEAAAKQLKAYKDADDAEDTVDDNNNKPPIDDTGNGGGGTTVSKTVKVTISAADGHGSPTINGQTVLNIEPNKTYTITPNASAGYEFDRRKVGNAAEKTTKTFSVSGEYSSLSIRVWYKRIDTGSGEETGMLPKFYGAKVYDANGKEYYSTGKSYGTQEAANAEASKWIKSLGAAAGSTKWSIKPYKTGGLVDYTGLAMVHGSASKPEAFLNAKQTAQIKEALMLQTKEGLLSSLQDSLLKFQSTIDGTVSGITSEANNSSINIQPGAVVIQVEELANNYDVEKLSNDVMNRMTAIAAKATNRGVNRR